MLCEVQCFFFQSTAHIHTIHMIVCTYYTHDHVYTHQTYDHMKCLVQSLLLLLYAHTHTPHVNIHTHTYPTCSHTLRYAHVWRLTGLFLPAVSWLPDPAFSLHGHIAVLDSLCPQVCLLSVVWKSLTSLILPDINSHFR